MRRHGMCRILGALQSFSYLMRLLHSILDPRHERLRLHAALVLYATVVIMGSIPGARVEVGTYASGLVLHFFTYAALAFLLFTGIDANVQGRAVKTVLIIAAMGAFDEFVQSFLPYRTAALGDWAVDFVAGLTISSLLWSLSMRIPLLQAAVQKRRQR
jgi:VanZ family protein